MTGPGPGRRRAFSPDPRAPLRRRPSAARKNPWRHFPPGRRSRRRSHSRFRPGRTPGSTPSAWSSCPTGPDGSPSSIWPTTRGRPEKGFRSPPSTSGRPDRRGKGARALAPRRPFPKQGGAMNRGFPGGRALPGFFGLKTVAVQHRTGHDCVCSNRGVSMISHVRSIVPGLLI